MTDAPTPDTAGGTNPLALAGGLLVDLLVTTLKILLLLVAIIIGLAVLAIPLVVLGPVVLLVFVLTLPFGGLYRHTLARRYLKRKLAPLFAGAGVALCTMMVIVVISIMGGFLELVRNSGHRQIGEVSMYAGLGGFPHYEKLIEEIEKLPEAEAATALIHAYGLLKLPGDMIKGVQVHGIDGEGAARVSEYRQTLYWDRNRPDVVQLRELTSQREELRGSRSHYSPRWNELADEIIVLETKTDREPTDDAKLTGLYAQREELVESKSQYSTQWNKLEEQIGDLEGKIGDYWRIISTVPRDRDPIEAALKMAPPWPEALEVNQSAMVTGIEVSPYNHRNSDGSYRFSPSVLGRALTLTVLPVSGSGGALTPSTDRFVVVNEFKSGVYDVDGQRIYIPFAAAQKMMLMDAAQKVDPDDPTKVIGTIPARCTEIQVAAAEGVTSEDLAQAVRGLYDRFRQEHRDLPHEAQMRISTWQQMRAMLINAVEKEKGLLTFLFGIISVVAVVLIGVLFYMIVLEKTRDIGILRAVGASRAGVASIFIGFGAAIGIIGAALGTLIAYLIVTYINEIHAWLGEGLGAAVYAAIWTIGGIVLGVVGVGIVHFIARVREKPLSLSRPALVFSAIGAGIAGLLAAILILSYNNDLHTWLNQKIRIVIWDRSIYFFDQIPNTINWFEVGIIVTVAVGASLVGAMIPAFRAGLVDPVRSLRYE